MIKDQLANLKSCIRAAVIQSDTLDRALRYGRYYGKLSWENCDGFFHDDELEQLLFTTFKSEISPRLDNCITTSFDWLHVISEAYDFGGHTKLLKQIIDIQINKGKTVAVAITRNGTENFESYCLSLGCELFYLNGSPAERVRKLVQIGRMSDMTMLHIHPDDLGAALGARYLRAGGKKVYFLNHADHVFSFGAGGSSAVLEISGFGWQLTEKFRINRAQHFIGIPIESFPIDRKMLQSEKSPILTIGSSNKYRPFNNLDFPQFAIELLDGCNRDLTIIGSDGSEAWWKQLKNRHGDRVKFFGRLSYTETREHLAAAACYIDSFPFTGGTVFTEALVSGKTVFGPPIPATGYGVADILRSSSVSEMTSEILDYLKTGVEPEQQPPLRVQAMKEYCSDAIFARLEKLEFGSFEPPPADIISVKNDIDHYTKMWLWGNQLSIKRKIYLLFPVCAAGIFLHKMQQKLASLIE